MIWDNEQISKSRDGQDGKSQLLIKFDQNSFCIPVNNEGEYNGTDIVNDLNINVDFGIYEGYQHINRLPVKKSTLMIYIIMRILKEKMNISM